MVFGIDYDGTIDEDRQLWEKIIVNMERAGHEVYIVTQNWRKDRPDIVNFAADVDVEVLFAQSHPKYKFCGLHNVYIDVWIDDDPRSIFT